MHTVGRRADRHAVNYHEAIVLVLFPIAVRAQLDQAAKAPLEREQGGLRVQQQDGMTAGRIDDRIDLAPLHGATFFRAAHQTQDFRFKGRFWRRAVVRLVVRAGL